MREADMDWLATAKAAGKYGIRYSTNARLVDFINEALSAAPAFPIPTSVANEGMDWTGGRAWPEMLEAIASYWAEWEEDRAGTGTYLPEELAQDAGEFATGLADHLAALSPALDNTAVEGQS